MAYEAAAPTGSADVQNDAAHERVLTSLDHGFDPQRPVGVTLGAAFDNLLQQAFDATYPAHPRFEPSDVEVRLPMLRAVFEHVERALGDETHRVPLQGDVAAVRRVADALGVGHAAETHFLFGDDRFDPWGQQFERELGRRGNELGPVTVREAKGWIDGMQPARGLRPEVADLVILAWGALRQRAWFSFGGSIPTPAPGGLRPEMELRVQELPDAGEWSRASTRAGYLFGASAGPYLTPQAVAGLAQALKAVTRDRYDAAFSLVTALEQAYSRLAIETDEAARRLATARRGAALLEQLRSLDGVELVRRLAADPDTGHDAAMGRSTTSASTVAAALRAFPWPRLRPLDEAASGEGTRADGAATILRRLQQALSADEIVSPCAAALSRAEEELFEWLIQNEPGPPPPPPPPPPEGSLRLLAQDSVDEAVLALTQFRQQHPDATIQIEWRIT